jgi:hypothetical protein
MSRIADIWTLVKEGGYQVRSMNIRFSLFVIPTGASRSRPFAVAKLLTYAKSAPMFSVGFRAMVQKYMREEG